MVFSTALLDDLFLNWEKSSEERRKTIAEQLEKELAKIQGRSVCPIVTKDAKGFDAAFNDGVIYINEKHLSESDKPYGLISLLLHEGRHATQASRSNIRRGRGESLALWQKNLIAGYLREGPDNVLQPVEYDAYTYQIQMLKRIYKAVTMRYGRNEEFENIILNLQNWFDIKNKEGRILYGDRYLDVINQKIESMFNIVEGFDRKYFVQNSRSGFLEYLTRETEIFLNQNFGRKCSLETFEQYIMKVPDFIEKFNKEIKRQMVIEQFNKIMNENVAKDSDESQRVAELFDQYLGDYPDTPLSLKGFKKYLKMNGGKGLLKWFRQIQRRKRVREWKGRAKGILVRNANQNQVGVNISRNMEENTRAKG